MEIIKVTPRGYCKGVVRAINIAKQTALQYPNEDIYILGMLVHNKYVIEALHQHGIKTIEDKNKSRDELLDNIDHGVVIFTAHGIHDQVKQKALDKGLITIDATCPDVSKTQQLVNTYLSRNFNVLYIGKKGHPEASAICGNNDAIHLIESVSDINQLPSLDNVFVTNQTTMSIYDIQSLFEKIKQKYPHAIFAEEVCSATRTRQEAITNLSNVDALIIVGDKASNNSNRLAQIGKEQGIPYVLLVDDVNDLEINKMQNFHKIAVSAGASTPTYLTNQVIECLENNDRGLKIIDIGKIL